MPDTNVDTYLERARLTLVALNDWFNPLRGRWKTTGWWNAASILTTITRFARLSGDDGCLDMLPSIFAPRWRLRRRDFINNYYDDEGWWAAAWLEAYAATGEKRYLECAESLFADMRGGWSDDCGGGIYWKKNGSYKAAIANSLYIYVAAGLFQATKTDAYRVEATRSWSWFKRSGLLGGDGLVCDGLGRDCTPAYELWTYNQGMMIGAAVLLHRSDVLTENTGERLIGTAMNTANAAIDQLTYLSGILREEGEPDLNRDRVQFKGILMRFLADLWTETHDPGIASFVRANADSLWANARQTGSNLVGASWQGPFDRADAGRQGSALDAQVAAAIVASPTGKNSP
jgi:predicted alpha-1,6-mannanase (GH76 family)